MRDRERQRRRYRGKESDEGDSRGDREEETEGVSQRERHITVKRDTRKARQGAKQREAT